MPSLAVASPRPLPLSFQSPALGFPIPATAHAVSVSLPTWRDNVGYEEGDPRVVDSMQTGYPRFFVHRSVQRLAKLAAQHLLPSDSTDQCFLWPTLKVALGAVDFLSSRTTGPSGAYYKEWKISDPQDASSFITIYPVFTSPEDAKVQKQYWQHTGDGTSSRLAEYCLHWLGQKDQVEKQQLARNGVSARGSHAPARGFSRNKHYSKKSSAALEAIMDSEPESEPSTSSGTNGISATNGIAGVEEDVLSSYIEERYARNLSEGQAPLAKVALRRRIAGVLRESNTSNGTAVAVNSKGLVVDDHDVENDDSASFVDEASQPTTRGVQGLTEDDVYLYPTGMSAIFHSFTTILHARKSQQAKKSLPLGKSVCFGFPYTDTLKILEKWGTGCHFYGRGLDSDLDSLEALLSSRLKRHEQDPESEDPESKPILSLFCEFPSNPLLRCPDLQRLKELKDKYGFMIVIDETIGGFINVECLPYADIVVSSLTKIFSGDSNVMGGALTLNPSAPHYSLLKQALLDTYEDNYFFHDAIFMERNSRDFQKRVWKSNENAEAICDLLNQHTVESGRAYSSTFGQHNAADLKPVVTKVYFPKFITPKNYLARIRQNSSSDGPTSPGYGALFSLTFTSLLASRVFFDELQCCKGPSLGTNFTLACPYTVLAHYLELDWALEWEVEEGLVRVSIGLEDTELLLDWFGAALRKAEEAEREEKTKNGLQRKEIKEATAT